MPARLILWAKKRWGVSQRTEVMSLGDVVRLGLRVGISRLYLRCCTCTGSLPRVWGRPRIENQGALFIGNRARLRSTVVPVELVVRPSARLDIGDHVFINYGASICAYEHIRIGDRCVLGVYTIITDNDQHDLWDRDNLPQSQPVTLEDNVWIGDRVTILKGVTIGRNSAIGAGSVVTRSIPPDSVAAGVPARVLRTL